MKTHKIQIRKRFEMDIEIEVPADISDDKLADLLSDSPDNGEYIFTGHCAVNKTTNQIIEDWDTDAPNWGKRHG